MATVDRYTDRRRPRYTRNKIARRRNHSYQHIRSLNLTESVKIYISTEIRQKEPRRMRARRLPTADRPPPSRCRLKMVAEWWTRSGGPPHPIGSERRFGYGVRTPDRESEQRPARETFDGGFRSDPKGF